MQRIVDLETPPSPNGQEVLVPESAGAWRQWLDDNHERTEGLWLVYRKVGSALEGPTYRDLLDEALCFGWIDSRISPVDNDRTMQWYSPRRKGSIWSTRNRDRIAVLEDQGRIADPGRAVIENARRDGSWASTDAVDSLETPQDLADAFADNPGSSATFEALPDSTKKRYLWWIHSAKRPATRANRVAETVRRIMEETS